MKNLVFIFCLLCLAISSIGCSSFAYAHNKDYALHDIAIRSNNPIVFQAYVDDNTVGMGVNLNALDYMFYDWKTTSLQLGAAVLDGVAVYYAADYINGLNDDDNETDDSAPGTGSGNNDTGRDTIVVNTEGNGNTTVVNTSAPNINEPPVEAAPME